MTAKSFKRLLANARNPKLVTGKLDLFLLRHDGIYSPDTAKLIAEQLGQTLGDKSKRWSPSTLTKCRRYHMLQYLGLSKRNMADVVQEAIFDDGRWRHLRWQANLYEARIVHSIEHKIAAKQHRLTGSVDAAGDDDEGEPFGVEIKGTSNIKGYRETIVPDHLIQVHAYFIATGWRKFSLIYDPKMGHDWHEHVIEYDEDIAAETLGILNYLNTRLERRRLAPILKECKHSDGPIFHTCPYSHVCHKAGEWPTAQVVSISRRDA